MIAAGLSIVLALGGCGAGGDDRGDADTSGGWTGSVGSPADGQRDRRAGDAPPEPTPPAFAIGEATTTLDVTLQDYVIVGVGSTVRGPNVAFTATVRGGNLHELEVVDDAGDVVGGTGTFRKGTTRTLAVTLAPGTYGLQCLVTEATRTHAQMGMRRTITVT